MLPTTTEMEMQYKIIKNIIELDKYKQVYDALIKDHAGEDAYYYLYDNLKSLSGYLENNADLCIVLVFSGVELILIAPLQIRKRHWLYLNSKKLEFLASQNHSLGSQYGELIYNKNTDIKNIELCLRDALESPDMPFWDEVCFTNVHSTTHLPIGFLGQTSISAVSSCYQTPTTQPSELLLKENLKRKSRSKLRKSQKLLDIDFEAVEFLTFTSVDEALFNDMARIHSQRQQFKREAKKYNDYTSLFDSDTERNAMRKLTNWLSSKKMLDLHVLKLDNLVVAFLYCVRLKTKTNALIMAFDNDYEKYSPSKLLAIYAIDYQYSEGKLTKIDFLADFNHFKHQFCPEEIKRLSINCVNRSRILSIIKFKYITLVKYVSHKIKNVIYAITRSRLKLGYGQ